MELATASVGLRIFYVRTSHQQAQPSCPVGTVGRGGWPTAKSCPKRLRVRTRRASRCWLPAQLNNGSTAALPTSQETQ
eukprot:11866252-Alexandrium_andersonii.AAC.1